MRRFFILGIFALLLMSFLTGCFSKDASPSNTTQFTTLNGESEHWQLQGYKLKTEGDTIFVGNGELLYKFDEIITDYISFKLVAQIEGNEVVLQEMKIVSSEGNYNKQDTGKAESKDLRKSDGQKITVFDKDELHGEIGWMSSNGERTKEIIYFQ